MYLQDLFGFMWLTGLLTILASLCVRPFKRAWAKNGLQIGGVIFIVGFIAFGYSPIKPRTPEQIASDAKWAEEKSIRDAKTARDEAVSALNAALEKRRQDDIDRRKNDIAAATVVCGQAIQRHLAYPGSYSETFFSSSNQQIETDQGWEIFKAFEAKNGFGGSLPHVGHCSIKRGGGITVEIGRS